MYSTVKSYPGIKLASAAAA